MTCAECSGTGTVSEEKWFDRCKPCGGTGQARCERDCHGDNPPPATMRAFVLVTGGRTDPEAVQAALFAKRTNLCDECWTKTRTLTDETGVTEVIWRMGT